jgi:hypothetical protein
MVNTLKPGQTQEEASAEMMVEGLGMNAVAAVAYSKTLGQLDLTECMASLLLEIERIRAGSLNGPEAILAAQAVTLNAMFTQLAYHTSQMTIVDQIDRFTRLAFKAQNQCRATLETLALIKNPPAVFAKQANIAHGPQQVNNTLAVGEGALARAEDSELGANRLLETHGARLDTRTTAKTGASDSTLEAVAILNRTSHA